MAAGVWQEYKHKYIREKEERRETARGNGHIDGLVSDISSTSTRTTDEVNSTKSKCNAIIMEWV